MKLKKLLAAVLVLAMAVSCLSISAFAANENQPYPEFTSSVLKGEALVVNKDLTLDYGMNFTAVDTEEDLATSAYKDYFVDFEVTLDKTTTAVMAGCYRNPESEWNGKWVPLRLPTEDEMVEFEDYLVGKNLADYGLTEYGIKFEAGVPFKVMNTLTKLVTPAKYVIKYSDGSYEYLSTDPSEYEGPGVILTDENGNYLDVANYNFIYSDVIKFVKSFDCGIRLSGMEDVNITVSLCLYPAVKSETPDEDGHFTFTEAGEPIVLGTWNHLYDSPLDFDDEAKEEVKVDSINNAVVDQYNKADITGIVADLSAEAQVTVNPEVLKELVEESADQDVLVIPGTNAGLEIEVEHKATESTATEVVFDITATVAGEPKSELEDAVLVKIAKSQLGLQPGQVVKKIMHEHNDVVSAVKFTQDADYLYIVTHKFSTYTIVLGAPLASGTAEFGFELASYGDGVAEFNLVLNADDMETIRGVLAGQFDIDFSVLNGVDVDYVIEPANDEIIFTEVSDDYYEFRVKASTAGNYWTEKDGNLVGNKLVLGKAVVTGYDAEVSIAASNQLVGKGFIEDGMLSSGKVETVLLPAVEITIPAPRYEVTVNVDLSKHGVEKATDDMKVVISGEDIDDITVTLDTVYDAATKVATVTKDLIKGSRYTITVSGLGYRTASYTFKLTEDVTINFWNSVDTNAAGKAMYLSATKSDSFKTKNFLIGDIVADGVINKYDLSAVVSYTGSAVDADTLENDLNRDDVINSLDTAIVLWNMGE